MASHAKTPSSCCRWRISSARSSGMRGFVSIFPLDLCTATPPFRLPVPPGKEQNREDRAQLQYINRDEDRIAGGYNVNEKENCSKKPDRPGREADPGRFAHTKQFGDLWNIRRENDNAANETNALQEKFHMRISIYWKASIAAENEVVKIKDNESKMKNEFGMPCRGIRFSRSSMSRRKRISLPIPCHRRGGRSSTQLREKAGSCDESHEPASPLRRSSAPLISASLQVIPCTAKGPRFLFFGKGGDPYPRLPNVYRSPRILFIINGE